MNSFIQGHTASKKQRRQDHGPEDFYLPHDVLWKEYTH